MARVNDGGFEFAAHVRIGRKAGISDAQIADLAAFRSSAAFNSRERAVMQYADEVSRNIQVSDEAWSEIAAFLGNRKLVGLVLNVPWYNQTSRVTRPLLLDRET